MTTKLFVERWEHGNNAIKTVKDERTEQEILNSASNALTDLYKLLLNNLNSQKAYKGGLKNVNFVFPGHNGSAAGLIGKGARTNRLEIVHTDGSQYDNFRSKIEKFTLDLQQIVKDQESFIEDVKASKQVHNRCYVDRAGPIMSTSHILDGQVCQYCGAVYPSNKMARHQLSQICKIDSANRDLREQQWQPVEDGPEIRAIREAGIAMELRPNGFTMWAPPWVKDAMEQFKRNNGFAGMSLTEYLNKMKPEDKTGSE